MQRIATKVFIFSSIAFGIIGLIMLIVIPSGGQPLSGFPLILSKLLYATVFIILPSFALSVAGKYLSAKK